MADTPRPKDAHDAGGTYAPSDMSPAAERTRLRDTQHYPSPKPAPQRPPKSPVKHSGPDSKAGKP